jgi:predicted NAD-dependent protein-ADP-ribosyltransferase YbiA (DUF1768 family)
MHCVRQLQKRRTHRFSTRLPGAALNGCDVAGSAQMASKKFREDHCRTAFEEVKLEVMRYYLGVKRAQHRQRFGALLSFTVDKPIVEESHKKDFLAAKAPRGNRVQLEGENNLGILLVALRAE